MQADVGGGSSGVLRILQLLRPMRTMPRCLLETILRVIAAGAVVLLAATAADAQYFGRNKVQYEDFDFKVLKTEHFDVYYYSQEQEAARMAARMAERWYARLSRIFDYRMGTRQPLILYASHPHFRQTNAVSGGIGEGTGGVTESFKRRSSSRSVRRSRIRIMSSGTSWYTRFSSR